MFLSICKNLNGHRPFIDYKKETNKIGVLCQKDVMHLRFKLV